MEQYTVTGMSCAACSARVEKAVKAVPGVTSCSVSLLTNSMGVEGTASASAIVKAVQEAGYGASPKAAAAETPSATRWAFARPEASRGSSTWLKRAAASTKSIKKAGRKYRACNPMMRIMPTGVLVMYMAVAAPAM